jgi:hypothetical protein
MFREAHRSSSGALNCICSLWFIYTCGDLPFSRLSLENLDAKGKNEWSYTSATPHAFMLRTVTFLTLVVWYVCIFVRVL